MDKVELNKQLIVAINNNDLDAVRECVEQGADVNTFEINGKKYNPLYCCIKTQNVSIFDYLVEQGADVTEKLGERKQSLLFCACHNPEYKLKIVLTIINNGGHVDINYAPKGGKSPMEIVKENTPEITQYFERALKHSQNKGR